ncbi:UNVERIFIED_CONTAM: hypothetical protein GTU68_026075 [Idotea baltica]|nr:hypothetical protein [Idotea baltica]
MGIGSNRVNKYTLGMATQGLANYLKKSFPNEDVKVAIAYDSRNNSQYFGEVTAAIFSANGIHVYLFEALRPTPELSFAIRELGCKSGVVLTASHNPKEYNGYKAYWDDGGQVVPPHDKNIIAEVTNISSPDEVNFDADENKITRVGADLDEKYLNTVAKNVVTPEAIANQSDLKIVFSSIHGTGITMVPPILEKIGFTNVSVVDSQATPDGNFPTVVYPNPEEKEAMSLALAQAKEMDADLVMATDPDADRVGIENEGKKEFIGGGEESYGYLIGDSVRDKDAVASCAMIAELVAYAKDNGLSLFDLLTEIYLTFGMYRERLFSIKKTGKKGAEEIQVLMTQLRSNPPSEIAGSPVTTLIDYQGSTQTDLATGTSTSIGFPKSNVLQFLTGDGTKVSARPSGTEPKIKFYMSVNAPMNDKEDFDTVQAELDKKLDSIQELIDGIV